MKTNIFRCLFVKFISNLKEVRVFFHHKINKVIEKNPITKENFLKLNIIERQKLFNESLSKTEKTRLKLFLLILLFILIYRIAYSQTNISIIYFIDGYVERDIGFYSIPVQLFCIFNPILILILGLIFVKFDDKLQEKKYLTWID